MTITADQIKKAFSSITEAAKPEPTVTVDMEKVASKLVADTAEFASSDDPIAKLDALVESVDKIDALLSDVTEDENGNLIAKDSDVAREFAIKADEPKTEGETAKSEPEVKPEEVVTEEETAKVEDLSDDIDWDRDLSPSVPPVRRSEVMTKNERPVPAQKGGRQRVNKMAEAREKALARRDMPMSGRRSLS